MELGNWIFGNSRGEYEVNRGLQSYFVSWLERLGFDGYGHPKFGNEWSFENDTFRIQPYYWGDCECGYEQREMEWSDSHDHAPDCYQILYRAIGDKWGSRWDDDGPAQEMIEALCKTMGLSYPQGSAVHCTCDYDDKWSEWAKQNQHAKDCLIVTPNFLHKPSGFELRWYKYPLRDSYSNKRLSKRLIRNLMEDCERSMKK